MLAAGPYSQNTIIVLNAVSRYTPERFLPRMRSNVRGEIGSLREALVAVAAAVRALARVRAQVRLQRAGPRVRLAADPAQVGLLFVVL